MSSLDPLAPSLALAGSWWLAALAGVCVSGAFPPSARPQALSGPIAGVLVWLLIASALALAGVSVMQAAARVAWPYLLVGAGIGAVLAPPCFSALPRGWWDRRSVFATLGVACIAATVTWRLAAHG